MFDLKREVDVWAEQAYAGPCAGKAATLAELRDHLYCEIESLEADGRSPEEAFRIATDRLGESAGNTDDARGYRALRQARIANAILWAALMLATSLVLARSDAGDSFTYLLIVVLIPIWFASDLLLARFLGTTADG